MKTTAEINQLLEHKERLHKQRIEELNTLLEEAKLHQAWQERFTQQLEKCKSMSSNPGPELDQELHQLTIINISEPELHTAFMFCTEDHDFDNL